MWGTNAWSLNLSPALVTNVQVECLSVTHGQNQSTHPAPVCLEGAVVHTSHVPSGLAHDCPAEGGGAALSQVWATPVTPLHTESRWPAA